MNDEKFNDFELEWVNHASYIIRHGKVSLITDPWLYGSAFDDGWDLLVESQHDIKIFDEISHIWFSHEHPDHFSTKVLFDIPEVKRKKITILFQFTKDKRVLKFCEKLGFQVMELENKKTYEIGNQFKFTIGKMVGIDSWSLTEICNFKILNVNDCVIDDAKTAQTIKRATGNCDLLLTQFSYANWISNPEEKEKREKSALEKLDRIKIQIETFKPKYTIPFASFVYFSHEKNFYMNDSVNTISVANDYITENTCSVPIILKPRDIWNRNIKVNNLEALKFYKNEYNNLSKKEIRTCDAEINIETLTNESLKYISKVKSKNNSFLLYLYFNYLVKEKIIFNIFDSDIYFCFDFKKGLYLKDGVSCDAFTTTHSGLLNVFKNEYGAGALMINGKFRANEKTYNLFEKYFRFGLWNSIGVFLTFTTVIEKIFSKILGKNEADDEFSFLGNSIKN